MNRWPLSDGSQPGDFGHPSFVPLQKVRTEEANPMTIREDEAGEADARSRTEGADREGAKSQPGNFGHPRAVEVVNTGNRGAVKGVVSWMGREYLGEIVGPSPALRKAVELWKGYDRQTDAFDARVCTGRRDGVLVPKDARERQLITENAREAHARVMQEAREAGIKPSVVEEARRVRHRWP